MLGKKLSKSMFSFQIAQGLTLMWVLSAIRAAPETIKYCCVDLLIFDAFEKKQSATVVLQMILLHTKEMLKDSVKNVLKTQASRQTPILSRSDTMCVVSAYQVKTVSSSSL